mmetsp:Transcript_18965/g.29304  ORF Transcript_18965/g.29304 Transcript_18965/m.29304 type:complete len:578 (-) Transcript_18965:126-1859(-)
MSVIIINNNNINNTISPYQLQQEEMNTNNSNNVNEGAANNNNNNDISLTLNEVLYSASSYHAIAKPVTLTMVLSAMAVVFINTEESLEQGEQQMSDAYVVWQTGSDSSGGNSSAGSDLLKSIGNSLVIVSVIALMTFGIVILYKYRCMKCLIGYMVFSSAVLLGVLGGTMLEVAIEKYRIAVDKVSFFFGLYNFALVGTIAVFFQQGIPNWITQFYLIATSVILAWQLSHFDAWTTWTLLVFLALYDLCAVLTPCGPLKALVGLMQQEGSPTMPGLLYEAELPDGVTRPSNSSTDSDVNVEVQASSTGASVIISDVQRVHHDHAPVNRNGTRRTSRVPLALACLYRLPVLSPLPAVTANSGDTSSSLLSPNADAPLLDMSGGNNDNAVNGMRAAAPAHNENGIRVRADDYSSSQLQMEVEVLLPPNGTKRIEREQTTRRHRDGLIRYHVIDNRSGVEEITKILVIDRRGKVFEEVDAGDDDSDGEPEMNSSIKLGLGDFIFYSVLVSKAAMYSFATFAACMLVILAGLGATLVLLSVYHKALPALPISIFLGVVFYLLTRTLIEPWIEDLLRSPYYV